jgi:hypothetical protein
VGAVAYDDIYIHPADPPPAGTATIKIWGANETHIRFTATAGAQPGSAQGKSQVEGETMDKGQTEAAGSNFVLMWKAPRAPKP